MSARIKKNDMVMVLSGKERGKTGRVLDIDRERERAVVEKLMVLKRHFKRPQPGAPGGRHRGEERLHPPLEPGADRSQSKKAPASAPS